MQIKVGSVWWAGDRKRFRVLSVEDMQGHTWVHYRNEPESFSDKNLKEYSCYAESFVNRFRQLPE